MLRCSLRALRDTDLPGLADLWFTSWHAAFAGLIHPMPREEWYPRLRGIAARCRCTVAVAEGKALGFAMLDLGTRRLEQIFVRPEHQGYGIGGALLQDARQRCPDGLTLTTLQRNQRAAAFYQRHGFKPTRRGINPVNGLPNVEYAWLPHDPEPAS